MKVYLHQNHHQIADFASIENYLCERFETKGLHVFSELFLTGYPLQDLCLQKPFIDRYQKLIKSLNSKLLSMKINTKINLLVGGLDYELTARGLPKIIKNVVFHMTPGKEMKAVYTKQLLPSYDIFDEAKYFTQGHASAVLKIEGKNIGTLICEDMWVSNIYDIDPCHKLEEHCKQEKMQLDLLVNLSASPYNLNKLEKRLQRASELSQKFACPFIYVNRVGGEDEILFDGNSFVADKDKIVVQGKPFCADELIYELGTTKSIRAVTASQASHINTWEDLFNATLQEKKAGLRLRDLDEAQGRELIDALIFGLQEYASKCGFNKFLVALSGGIDSALVLTLAKLALKEGQTLEAIYMPSQFSATMSYDLSFELCKNLGVSLKTFSIKFLHSSVKNAYLDTFSEMLSGVADENVQSRLRGMLIYTHSNKTGAMVINTSNKSELAVGYSTQYGDSVGAISMLGDLYKSEVFEVSKLVNKLHGDLLPTAIIEREPSAELRPGQIDTDSLPPYEILDAILEGILSYQMSKQDFIEHGFSTQVVEKVFNLYRKTEYKRVQFCPIIKVKGKSFGFGYRIGTSKCSDFYLD
jgi:NAD+ synthase (glutamine-hydrolysing)